MATKIVWGYVAKDGNVQSGRTATCKRYLVS
jgi:hypothetical protein